MCIPDYPVPPPAPRFTRSLVLALFTAAALTAVADTPASPGEMSLEELLNTPVSVASKSKQTARESPGIVTLITAEEIANSGLVYYSARYGYVGDGAGNGVLKRFSASPLISLFAANEDVFVRGLRLDLGVHDLAGDNHEFIQPYNSGHAPLPGPTREYLIRLTYHPRAD